jgi:hypothetical protein
MLTSFSNARVAATGSFLFVCGHTCVVVATAGTSLLIHSRKSSNSLMTACHLRHHVAVGFVAQAQSSNIKTASMTKGMSQME